MASGPTLLGCFHIQCAPRSCVRRASATTGEAKGRDRGVNSAPVVLHKPQREGRGPPFVILAWPRFSAALAATSLLAYVDQTLMERICNSLPANARGANIKSKSSTGTTIC